MFTRWPTGRGSVWFHCCPLMRWPYHCSWTVSNQRTEWQAFPSNHTLPVLRRGDDALAEKQQDSVYFVIGSTSQMVS